MPSSSAKSHNTHCPGPVQVPPISTGKPLATWSLKTRPPTRSRASRTAIRVRPAVLSARAAARPEKPAPITATSSTSLRSLPAPERDVMSVLLMFGRTYPVGILSPRSGLRELLAYLVSELNVLRDHSDLSQAVPVSEDLSNSSTS